MPRPKPKSSPKAKRLFEADTLSTMPLILEKTRAVDLKKTSEIELAFWELNGYPSREVVQRIIEKLEQG